MLTKKCSKCGEVKGREEFHVDRSNYDGRYHHCKLCRKGMPRAPKSEPAMEGVKRCNKCGEVKAVTEFHADRQRKGGRYGSCKPCRAAYTREYRTTWQRPRQYEPATDGEKKCAKCGEAKCVTEFPPNPRVKDGRHSYCRQCKRDHYKDNRREPVTEGEKTCAKCGETKHVNEFWADCSVADGRMGTCRGCMADRLRELRKTPHGRMASRSSHRRRRFAAGINSPKPEVRGPARLATAVQRWSIAVSMNPTLTSTQRGTVTSRRRL